MIFKLQKNNNKVKRATFITSPAETILIVRALSSLVNDEAAHDDDRHTAKQLIEEIKKSKYENEE